jgi:hypothetical protein
VVVERQGSKSAETCEKTGCLFVNLLPFSLAVSILVYPPSLRATLLCVEMGFYGRVSVRLSASRMTVGKSASV